MSEHGDLIGDCVHCGFCLPTCPTYVLWGEEMDSPRGRIHLMKQQEEGAPLTDSMIEHFDRCLGCMACVTACPSGVQYDKLIETTRARIEASLQDGPDRKIVGVDAGPTGRPVHPDDLHDNLPVRNARAGSRTRGDRLLREAIFAVFPYPARLAALSGPLRLYQKSRASRLVAPLLERLSPTLAAMERLAPPVQRRRRLPARVAARGERRAVVGMLTGCVQGAFFPGVNAATARVLAMEGCDVVIPRAQGCCGALSRHSGRAAEADRFAERTAEAFADVDVVVVNSAGCGSAMKESPTLAAKTRDLTEFLAELGPRATRHPLDVTIAYHDACHLAHAQGIRAQPRDLLTAIPGLTLREIADPDICCGSAGVYNLLQPVAAAELGDRKAADVAATGASLLVAANPGCSMQIATALRRDGREIAVAHPAEVLDASIRGLSSASLTHGHHSE
jgi:glycolate oxidase iron-sulfur subunit